MVSESQKRATEKYVKENWGMLSIRMPKSELEAVKDFCRKNNTSLAGFIRKLIKDNI